MLSNRVTEHNFGTTLSLALVLFSFQKFTLIPSRYCRWWDTRWSRFILNKQRDAHLARQLVICSEHEIFVTVLETLAAEFRLELGESNPTTSRRIPFRTTGTKLFDAILYSPYVLHSVKGMKFPRAETSDSWSRDLKLRVKTEAVQVCLPHETRETKSWYEVVYGNRMRLIRCWSSAKKKWDEIIQ